MTTATGIQIFDKMKNWQQDHDINAQTALKMLEDAKTPQERSTIRSKTFPGIAKAIAEQWSEYVLKDMEKEK